MGGLPIGLAHGVTLNRAVAAGQPVRWSDVSADLSVQAVRVRKEMEEVFAASLNIR
jgi:predicted homoserine dehydrogenase-like protein